MLDARRIEQLALVAALAALATMVGGALQVTGPGWPGGDGLAFGLLLEPTVLVLLVLPTATVLHPRTRTSPMLVAVTIGGAALQAYAWADQAWTYRRDEMVQLVGGWAPRLVSVALALTLASVAALMGVLVAWRRPTPNPTEAT